jgi:transposase
VFFWALIVRACAVMPRSKGAKNYKNEVLIPIVAEILPHGDYGWLAVGLAYQEQAREDDPCNTDDLRRRVKNLCQNMKKPTGRPGENSDRTHRSIAASPLNARLWKKRMQE